MGGGGSCGAAPAGGVVPRSAGGREGRAAAGPPRFGSGKMWDWGHVSPRCGLGERQRAALPEGLSCEL